ncbi:TPA: YjbH domain-containing protein [Vibrio parahaemolyticus]|uniref:YjbH domain-containing protein n=1 Tax=Vibrio parahaemolyticus TaxID=670 RepID=UPI0013EE5822|nr:YjbH domain-containing protein [Vibrio parahaemolyticus]ELA9812857.1 YjbH domain-containing protein [Vibrio parahaemolyticus]ELA9888055.1 YjbH domain-containing protein [Vibrio parahaemolyticus]HCE2073804.1 YjbH domain-containing protein [Vibrio parahaemolyticus]HCH2580811.1 YjbH domain-containing protein [Vibrio parahaemolyticus]HCH3499862.1 YjbH domain-containing protein [Vibrio parahaemolyticus]
MDKKIKILGTVACSLPLSAIAFADLSNLQDLPSNQSFTGVIYTPNAQTLEYGLFRFTFAQGLPAEGVVQASDSLNFSLGLLEGLEAHGRIITTNYSANCFVDGCGIRDLSMSFKYQIPNYWSTDNFNIAVGVEDFGGELSYFDAYYGVADYTLEDIPLRLSIGYGKSDNVLGVLDGAFGSIEYQPFDFVQFTGEYDSAEFNSSVKFFTPESLLPYDMTASLSYQVYSDHDTDDQAIWNAALSVPLITNYTRSRDYARRNGSLMERLALEQGKANNASISALINTLRNEGFVNIQIGTLNKSVVVSLENRRYNHNQVDGLGVALGIVSSHLGQNAAQDIGTASDQFELVMLANQKPVVSVLSDSNCYQSFVNGSAVCDDIQFITRDLSERLDMVDWKTKRVNSGTLDSQIVLSPMVRHGVATEYGVYDYSFAMSSNLYSYLWSGAAIDVRHILPLAESDDFEEGGYFEDSAYENEIDRAMVHQFFRLPYVDIANQVSLGLVKSDYIGARSESAWFSQSGNHWLGLEMSYFQHQDEKDKNGYANPDRQTFLTRYTFSMPEWDWQFNATAGEFWKGDVGAKFTTSHWFEDIEVSASYQVTKFNDTDEEQFVTVSVKLPLTPWRDMSPGVIQVRGNEAYDFNVTTRVGNDYNYLAAGQGDELVMDNSMLRRYFNRGRYGQEYFEQNKLRIRNAYLRYLGTQLN